MIFTTQEVLLFSFLTTLSLKPIVSSQFGQKQVAGRIWPTAAACRPLGWDGFAPGHKQGWELPAVTPQRVHPRQSASSRKPQDCRVTPSTLILLSEFKMERSARLVTAVRWWDTREFQARGTWALLGGGHLPCPHLGPP